MLELLAAADWWVHQEPATKIWSPAAASTGGPRFLRPNSLVPAAKGSVEGAHGERSRLCRRLNEHCTDVEHVARLIASGHNGHAEPTQIRERAAHKPPIHIDEQKIKASVEQNLDRVHLQNA